MNRSPNIFSYGSPMGHEDGMMVGRRASVCVLGLLVLGACVPQNLGADAPRAAAHIPPMVKDAVMGDAIDGNAMLDLRLALPLHNEAELDALLIELYDPNSPKFGKYVSPGQFAARYLPDANDVAAVVQALAQSHLDVQPTAHGTLLQVAGRVADVQAAMGTVLYNYTSPGGESFVAPSTEVQLPDGLKDVVVHGLVAGVTSHAQYTRMPSRPPSLGPMRFAAQPALNAGAIRSAYNVPAAMQGDGQSVGLFQLDHFDPNDIINYCRINNLPLPHITAIYIDGAGPEVTDENIQVEVTLDIELLHAMAPKLAEIRLYQGPTRATFQNYLDVLNEMANPSLGDKKLLKILSTSYGYFENQLSDAALKTEGIIFKQMAAQGQSFFAAAGDSGAYANPNTPTVLAVIDPAAQPFVTAVGGTRLKVGLQSSYTSETTWAQGGGGASRFWPLPDYQTDLGSYDPNLASVARRNVPDVALNADPNTGYAIYVQGGTSQVGGTSCGSPQWAGFMALINAERAAQGQGALGFFNPILYRMMEQASGPTLVHDVTTGNNGYYAASASYDNATGWGSPNGSALLSAFFLSAPRRTFTTPNWVLR